MQNFYNLMVVNKTTGKGVFGQPDGNFQIYASPRDTIILSVKKYPSTRFIVSADSNCQMKVIKTLVNRTQEEREVIIRPLKSIQQIKEERANLAMRDTKTTTNIDVFQSPITYLYERFSQKAQSKQKVAELKHLDNQHKIVKELLRLYVAYDIVQLSDEEFDDFISFLNISENFLKTSTDLELITYIQDKLEHYKLEILRKKK